MSASTPRPSPSICLWPQAGCGRRKYPWGSASYSRAENARVRIKARAKTKMYSNVLRRVSPAAGLLLLATLGLPKSAFGLDPSRKLTQYVHRIWQSQQGLPQGAILQIFRSEERRV